MAFKVPADIAKAAIAAGCTKCNITWQKLLILGFLAGAYIAFGALLSEIVAGGLSNGTITDPDGGIWKIALPAGLIKFAAGKNIRGKYYLGSPGIQPCLSVFRRNSASNLQPARVSAQRLVSGGLIARPQHDYMAAGQAVALI